jgi:ABC-type sugar transport system ATPase subunit
MLLEGKTIAPRSPREAIAAGIGLLTEDRNRLGLIAGMTVRENVTLASLNRLSRGPFVRRAEEAATVADLAERLRIRAASIEAHVSSLSGGNRQKVVLARWLTASTKVLIFDEPTAGVDVGAREEIYKLIRGLALEGRAILVISSDLTELLDLCDRIAVMSRGALAGELTGAEATRERVMALATRDAHA